MDEATVQAMMEAYLEKAKEGELGIASFIILCLVLLLGFSGMGALLRSSLKTYQTKLLSVIEQTTACITATNHAIEEFRREQRELRGNCDVKLDGVKQNFDTKTAELRQGCTERIREWRQEVRGSAGGQG